MIYYGLHPVLRFFVIMLLLPLLWMYVIFLANVIYLKQKRSFLILSAAAIATTYFLFQVVVNFKKIVQKEVSFLDFSFFPVWMFLMILLGLIAFGIRLLVESISFRNWHITGRSVKEAIDAMSDGICFYTPIGIPKMFNSAIVQICEELTGRPLQNAALFWTMLFMGEVRAGNTVIQAGDVPIIKTAQGRVYIFHRTFHESTEHGVYELFSSDITEEYNKTQELKERKEELEEMNRRLQEYSAQVTKVTIEKEILAAKIRIHDRMGQALLAAQHYLQTEGGDMEAMKRLWQPNLLLLKSDAPEEIEDEYEGVLQAAADVGIFLNIAGEFPQQPIAKALIANALHECITNAIRHADADTVFVEIQEKPDSYVALFKNNGLAPAVKIKENGGLAHLRHRVEATGNTMQIESLPCFQLMLKIKKEEL